MWRKRMAAVTVLPRGDRVLPEGPSAAIGGRWISWMLIGRTVSGYVLCTGAARQRALGGPGGR